MKIPSMQLSYLGIYALCACCAAATSFRKDNPRHVVRLEDVTYSTTPITRESPENVMLSFRLGSEPAQRIVLDLARNDDIFSQPILLRHISADGSEKSAGTIPAGSHLAYRGTASVQSSRHGRSSLQRRTGWARLSFFVRNGTQLGQGAFSIDDTEYHLQPDYKYHKSRSSSDPEIALIPGFPSMIAWREAMDDDAENQELRKRQENNVTCGAFDLEWNEQRLDFATLDDGVQERQAGALSSIDLEGSIGSTAGCPSSRQIALLGIATDCSYTSQYGSSDELREHVLSLVNTASRLYEQSFNISLRVQNLTISDANCPNVGGSSSTPWNLACSSGASISDRLQLFTRWRRSLGADGNAVWSLLSTCNSGSTVGIAWIGTVCSGARGRSQGLPGTNVVVRTRSEWQVLAHEIAHNFGAVHDCSEACNSETASERCCPLSSSNCDANARFIMNPSSVGSMTEFSPCTIGNICTAMGRNLIRTTCLSGNENVTTISSGVCGNGIVEPGEECDCGGPERCGSNSCCNPTTCRLVDGAACDATNDGCCTPQCQVSSRGSICRASLGPCDPEEVCDGSSKSCPADEREPDGQTCGDGNNGTTLTCASGQCTSRARQCSMALFNSTEMSGTVSACSSTECQMNCLADAQSSSCQMTGADFLDGTPCGEESASGLCYGGECRASGGGNAGGSSWADRNKTILIVVVVVVVVGSLLVVLAIGCCISRVRRKSRVAQMERETQPAVSGERCQPLPRKSQAIRAHRYA